MRCKAASLGTGAGTAPGPCPSEQGRDSPRAVSLGTGPAQPPGRRTRLSLSLRGPRERGRACAPRSSPGGADAAGAALRPPGRAGSAEGSERRQSRPSRARGTVLRGEAATRRAAPVAGEEGLTETLRSCLAPGPAVVGGASVAASRSPQSLQPALGRARPSGRGGC